MSTKRHGVVRLTRRATFRLGGSGIAATALAGQTQPVTRTAAQAATPAISGTPVNGTVAVSGQAAPELAAFDNAMTAFMRKWHVPGGQLAVAKDGRLVLDHGYGFADVEQRAAVEPDHLFRIASVSKTITTVAILTLVDDGKLALDDKVFPLLNFIPPPHATLDPRLNEITVKDLLVHTGGWDSSKSFDPQYLPWSRMAAATTGENDPAEAATIVRFMLSQPLDFNPGAESVYSNFGFNVLGRIIEKVSGQSYGNYCLDRVLTPAGIETMRLGRTRLTDRYPSEVRYYSPADLPPQPSVFWGDGYVPAAYGSFYLEAMDAHGGWIATAADLARFATAIDGQHGTALLKPGTVQEMIATPRPRAGLTGAGNPPVVAGLGWDMQPVAGGVEWTHAGALEGSNSSWLYRGPNELTMAYVFNTLPNNYVPFFTESFQALRTAAAAVQTWPGHDLFVG